MTVQRAAKASLWSLGRVGRTQVTWGCNNYSIHGKAVISMRTTLCLTALASSLVIPASAQTAQPSAAIPTVTVQPLSQTVAYGSNAILTVEATGSPLYYQWQKNGVELADYDNVAGAYTKQLALVGIGQRDEADYSVVVYNSAGAVTSVVATVRTDFMTVFSDDFEDGALSNWTAFSDTPGLAAAVQAHFLLQNPTNVVPGFARRLGNLDILAMSYKGTRLVPSAEHNHTEGGSQSAQLRRPRDKMYHNLGTKLAGRVRAMFWIYDSGEEGSSYYGEIRGYTGPGQAVYYQSAGLRQLIAIGRCDIKPTDSVTGGFPDPRLNKWAEKPDRTKYQARITRGTAAGSSWFNLNASGAPDRSPGWHKFEILRGADGTTVDFFVDGVFARRMTGAMDAFLDCVVIGSTGASGNFCKAWFDDVKVEAVPWRYDWQSKDTVGKGLFDWMQLRETGTDPQVTDVTQVSTASQADGAAASVRLGRWQPSGRGIYALAERGALDFMVQAPAPDAYRLEVEAWEQSDKNEPFDPVIALSIDGENLGRFLLPYNAKSNGLVRCFTPYLGAGSHTVHVAWDGARSHASLGIAAVRLQTLAGPDANRNGIKDWVETRLLSQNGLEVAPSASAVSPACVEGRGQYLSMIRCTAGTVGDQIQAIPIQAGAGHRWYANVPLSPLGATRVQLAYQSDAFVETKDITWQVSNLLQAKDMTIRQGDALLLTAAPPQPAGGSVWISVVGVTNYATDPATPIVHRFDQRGTYQVAAIYSGQTSLSRSITVRVVGASFPEGPAAALVAKPRYWDCSDLPAGVVLDADPRLHIAEVPDVVSRKQNPSTPPLADGSRRFRLLTGASEPRLVLARLGVDGPVLASTIAQGFRIFTTYDTYLRYVGFYPDGSQMLEGGFIVSPRSVLDLGVTVDIKMTVRGVTLEDGTLARTLKASDFDDLGICRLRFWRAADIQTTVCHTAKPFQNNVPLGRAAYEK